MNEASGGIDRPAEEKRWQPFRRLLGLAGAEGLEFVSEV